MALIPFEPGRLNQGGWIRAVGSVESQGCASGTAALLEAARGPLEALLPVFVCSEQHGWLHTAALASWAGGHVVRLEGGGGAT